MKLTIETPQDCDENVLQRLFQSTLKALKEIKASQDNGLHLVTYEIPCYPDLTSLEMSDFDFSTFKIGRAHV